MLLSRGGRITLNKAGISAYTLALWRRDRELTQILTGLKPPTGFFDAVLSSNLPAVKNWLSRGESANGKFVNEAPILHAAVRRSSPEVVKALLEAGANVKAKGAFAERTAIVEALTEEIDGPKTAEEESRRTGVVKALLNGGASPLDRDTRTGYSTVMFAAKRNSLPLVTLLMSKGAVVEKEDLENLRLVAPNISREIVELLKSGQK